MQFESRRFFYIISNEPRRIEHSGQWPVLTLFTNPKRSLSKVLSEFLAVELILNEIVPDIPKQEVIDPNDGFTNQVGLTSGRDFNLSVPKKSVKF